MSFQKPNSLTTKYTKTQTRLQQWTNRNKKLESMIERIIEIESGKKAKWEQMNPKNGSFRICSIEVSEEDYLESRRHRSDKVD